MKTETKFNDSTMTSATAISELIQASTLFYSRGWMMGTSGNLSICLDKNHEKHEVNFVITASGKEKGQLTPEDFVHLNNLTPVDNYQPKPSAETALHEMIYHQIANAYAVYHVHTVAATVLSQKATKPFIVFENLEMQKGLGLKTHEAQLELPVYPNSQDIETLAKTIAASIQPNWPGFVLKGHGAYVWGNTPSEAKNRLECLLFLMDCQLQL